MRRSPNGTPLQCLKKMDTNGSPIFGQAGIVRFGSAVESTTYAHEENLEKGALPPVTDHPVMFRVTRSGLLRLPPIRRQLLTRKSKSQGAFNQSLT